MMLQQKYWAIAQVGKMVCCRIAESLVRFPKFWAVPAPRECTTANEQHPVTDNHYHSPVPSALETCWSVRKFIIRQVEASETKLKFCLNRLLQGQFTNTARQNAWSYYYRYSQSRVGWGKKKSLRDEKEVLTSVGRKDMSGDTSTTNSSTPASMSQSSPARTQTIRPTSVL